MYQNTFLILLHKPIIYIILVPQRMWQYFTVELMLSSILFSQYTVLEWNKPDWNIQNSKTIKISFRNLLLKSGWPIPKLIYNIYNPTGVTLLIKLKVRLSHLNQHKLNISFRDFVNHLCPCSLEIESPLDFSLHFHYFTGIWKTFFNEKPSVDENTLNQSDNEIEELLL